MDWKSRFEWRGLTGDVSVECIANDDPVGYGTVASTRMASPCARRRCGTRAAGTTQCSAGYNSYARRTMVHTAMTLSRIRSRFFGDARSPYCWYGTEPTLFDAPSRVDREPLAWLAHSFLATTPLDEILDGNPRRVVPLLGFAWGFDITSDSVTLRQIEPLADRDWKVVLPALRAAYPSPFWTFAESL